MSLTNETLTYPSTLSNIPDEHTTFIPVPLSATGSSKYLVFASSKIKGGLGGTVVLETFDLRNFFFATADGYADQVMSPPIAFTICDPLYDIEFDENYAAPGSVVQDPTLPSGNFIMIYEAENHCPGGVWQQHFYATTGFARSANFGRTWPAPIDSEFGGPLRHPALKGPIPEPPEPTHAALGDAIPSAFVDRNAAGEFYLYVTYNYAAGIHSDGLLRIARARLGTSEPQFLKFYNGVFSEPGIAGLDSPFLSPLGCVGAQHMGAITYNDDLRLYLLTFMCNTLAVDGHASWYYSTATSLDLQDWTVPRMILNSRHEITSPCSSSGTGSQFDGFYPSFMSPGAAAGHTKLTGLAYLLNGCDTGSPRIFAARTFTITPMQ